MDVVLAILLTLVIIFVVPVLVYGLFVRYWGLSEPERTSSFLISVLVQKVGTAIGFVVLFAMAREYFADNWLAYGLVWAAMYAIVEIGQAMGPGYTNKEAVAGIISEVIYFPASALVTAQLLS
jgi:hypothetical protein